MKFIDTHAHIYSEEFSADRSSIISKSKEAGIEAIYMPNVDSASIEQMFLLEQQYPGYCIPMMGLHPCSVKENFEKELEIVDKWLSSRLFVAVGEIGIDLYWDKTFFEQQKEAFTHQIQLAKKLSIPVVIHCRNSIEETLEIVAKLKDERLKGIFHCFTGTLDQAKRVIDMGFFLGIGGVATYKNGGLDKVLPFIEPDKIVFETDSPYLAPVPHRGKRNDPAYIPTIANKASELMKVELSELAEITYQTSKKIFS